MNDSQKIILDLTDLELLLEKIEMETNKKLQIITQIAKTKKTARALYASGKVCPTCGGTGSI